MRTVMLALFLGVANGCHAMLEGVFLYFPSHSSDNRGLTPWKPHGQVIGYHQPRTSPRAVWLVTHGNAGQASQRQYIVDLLPPVDQVHVLEYPGYGDRPGKPSMRSINAAAAEAYQLLRAQHPGLPVNVLGESLGTGPASHLCSLENPPDRVILIVPFNTLLALAEEHMPYLPVSLLLRDRWDNARALARYKGRIDLYGAQHDEIIPVHHAIALAQALPSARYHELPCGHNDWPSHVRIAH